MRDLIKQLSGILKKINRYKERFIVFIFLFISLTILAISHQKKDADLVIVKLTPDYFGNGLILPTGTDVEKWTDNIERLFKNFIEISNINEKYTLKKSTLNEYNWHIEVPTKNTSKTINEIEGIINYHTNKVIEDYIKYVEVKLENNNLYNVDYIKHYENLEFINYKYLKKNINIQIVKRDYRIINNLRFKLHLLIISILIITIASVLIKKE